MEKKTHWKKTFNKDYLGAHDLDEGQELKLIIKDVKVTEVTDPNGKKGKCNVAYFTSKTKPMILNVTACKQIKRFTESNYIEDWKNVAIQVYVKTGIKAFGEETEGLRIRDYQPKLTKPEFTPKHEKWKGAVNHYKENKSLESIKKHYILSPENEKKLINEANIS
jgi:hypothetical protein